MLKENSNNSIFPFIVGKREPGRSLSRRLPGMVIRILVVLPCMLFVLIAALIALPVWALEAYERWCGKEDVL